MSLDKNRALSLHGAMIALLLVWPVVHVALSLSGKLSSWKLGGWGMYATTHPRRTPITILWLDSYALPAGSLGDLLEGIRVMTLVDGRATEIDYGQLSETEIDDLLELSGELQALRWDRHFRRLVSYTGTALRRTEPYRALVFFSELRVRLTSRQGYVRTTAYLYDADEVTRIGRFDSSQTSEDEMIAAIHERLLENAEPTPGSKR